MLNRLHYILKGKEPNNIPELLKYGLETISRTKATLISKQSKN